MGLLQKMHLVEEVDNTETEDIDYTSYEDDFETEANLDEVRVDTLISDIYTQNNLLEENGIFKVEEVMNNLPKEMTTETKRQTVASILSSFGVTTIQVVEDGERRTDVLIKILNNLNVESDGKISDMEDSIENLKQNIADLEKQIADTKAEQKSSTETINAELERIDNLLKFIHVESGTES
jgi:vacuolar-type H+-ATPase subunit I/STV1